jgi:hypothetical protein
LPIGIPFDMPPVTPVNGLFMPGIPPFLVGFDPIAVVFGLLISSPLMFLNDETFPRPDGILNFFLCPTP